MQRLLNITIISITANIVYTQEGDIREHQSPKLCGGSLKGPLGIIQTPNFPDFFTVLIKCKWIIEHDIVNGTISIYFTQQYTTSGLTFTEYMYYDESYKLGGRKALTVTEENITRNNWLQKSKLAHWNTVFTTQDQKSAHCVENVVKEVYSDWKMSFENWFKPMKLYIDAGGEFFEKN